MVICSCRRNILNNALGSGEILYRYSWLIDSYVLDFFTEDLWGRIPSNWQDVLEDLTPQELGLWLDQNKIPRYRTPWPLSLLALKSSISKFSLPRKKYCVCDNDGNARGTEQYEIAVGCSKGVSENFVALSKKPDDFQKNIIRDPEQCRHLIMNGMIDLDSSVHQLRGYIYAFQKHVKPKKRHEIFQMAKVVCKLAVKCEVSHVVDIGAGLGHLGRLLSYGHNLQTCCIESQRTLSSSARKLDEELEYTLSKYLSEEQHQSLVSPVHITSKMTQEMDSFQFTKLVTEAFCDKKKEDDEHKDISFGIVGLHPCGDLAVTLLRLFSDCSAARFICIAGCCYMKLTPGSGFPLSQRITKLSMQKKDLQLSYEAREMACHAFEAYSRKLLSENHSHLKIHCYRATLEAIIAKNWPHLRHSGLRSIKYSEGLQFSQYAKSALSSLEIIPPEEDLHSVSTMQCLQRWRHVVIFYSLRLMFASLVESFVLYDRLLYLIEKGFPCSVSPEFDPETSPRNHLLISFKPSDESRERSAS